MKLASKRERESEAVVNIFSLGIFYNPRLHPPRDGTFKHCTISILISTLNLKDFETEYREEKRGKSRQLTHTHRHIHMRIHRDDLLEACLFAPQSLVREGHNSNFIYVK